MPLRPFLDSNKIFFETIAATMLAVMAVVVSVAQTCTARRQTDLQLLQTRIAEAQALPQFEIRFVQVLDETTHKYDTNVVTVSNRGGPVHNVSVESAEFLRMEAARQFGENFIVQLPLNGYFGALFSSVSTVGDLATLTGQGNNAREIALARSVSALAKQQNWLYANLDVRIILRLRYADLLDRQHVDYFEVRPISGGSRLPEKDGAALFAQWRQGPWREFSEVTPQIVLAAVPASAHR